MSGQIEDDVKQARKDELVSLFQRCSEEWAEAQVRATAYAFTPARHSHRCGVRLLALCTSSRPCALLLPSSNNHLPASPKASHSLSSSFLISLPHSSNTRLSPDTSSPLSLVRPYTRRARSISPHPTPTRPPVYTSRWASPSSLFPLPQVGSIPHSPTHSPTHHGAPPTAPYT